MGNKNTKNKKFINKKNLLNLAFNNKRYFLTGLVIGGFGSALIFHKKQNFLFRNLSVGIGSCSILSILFLIFKNRKKANNEDEIFELPVKKEILKEVSVSIENSENDKDFVNHELNKLIDFWKLLDAENDDLYNKTYLKKKETQFQKCKEILKISKIQIYNLKNFKNFCAVEISNSMKLYIPSHAKYGNSEKDQKKQILENIINLISRIALFDEEKRIDGDKNMPLYEKNINVVVETVCRNIDQYIDILQREILCCQY